MSSTSTIVRRKSRLLEQTAISLIKVALLRYRSQDFDERYQQYVEDHLGRYDY